MILRTFAIFMMILGFTFSVAQASAQSVTEETSEFLSIVPDLPLMPGLYEIEELSMSFDKPEGRIVIAEAEGDVTTDAVLGFYSQVLPQLGWAATSYNAYERQGETLTITPVTDSGILQVKFFVKPQ